MPSYVILAGGLIILIIVLDYVFKTRTLGDSHIWLVFLILCFFTLIFDSILTGLPVILYNKATLLGIKIGTIPIEDFSYVFVAAFLPAMCKKIYERR